MPFRWIRTPDKIVDDIQRWADTRIYAKAARNAESFGSEILNWMQTNAPWEDRTGDARGTLYYKVLKTPEKITVEIGYGVPYGVYLETMQLGRFAILGPAIGYWGPKISERMLQK